MYLEDGKLTGFLGIIPRPMVFRGKPVTAATLTQFMVDPEKRRSSAAMSLLRRCFQGPQDLTWADGSADPVYMLHKVHGSLPAYFYSLHWMRVLRPFEMARGFLPRFGMPGRGLHGIASLVTIPADALVTRLPPFKSAAPVFTPRSASPAKILACIQEIGWREPLTPHYDPDSFNWLLSQTASAKAAGSLRMLIAQDAAGQDCGWLVYQARRQGTAYLLQMGMRRSDHFEPLLQVLFADAWNQGCAVVKGSTRPEYLTGLTRNYCVIRHPGSSALIHSRNADLLNTVRLGEAALSGLDGERWQRFASENW